MWPVDSCHSQWPWMTLMVICLLRGISNAIRRTFFCVISRGFNWHGASRGPSAIAELFVCHVLNVFNFFHVFNVVALFIFFFSVVCIFGFRVVLLGYIRLSALLVYGVQHLGTYFILKLDAVCCMFIRGCARRIVCAKVVKKIWFRVADSVRVKVRGVSVPFVNSAGALPASVFGEGQVSWSGPNVRAKCAITGSCTKPTARRRWRRRWS